MADMQMFKSAMGGFNKQEVMEYIQKLERDQTRKLDVLANQIKGMEHSLTESQNIAKDKEIQVRNLYQEVEKAQMSEAQKYNEISELMEKMTKGEKALKDTIEQMEMDFNNRLSIKNRELESTNEQLKEKDAELSGKQIQFQEAKEEYKKQQLMLEQAIGDLENREEKAQAELREKNMEIVKARQELDTVRREYNQKITQIERDYSEKVQQAKAEQVQKVSEMNNKYQVAMDSAKDEIFQIRDSLENARLIEENAKKRANELIEEAKKCSSDLIDRTQNEIEVKRAEAFRDIDRQLEEKRSQLAETKRILELTATAIKDCKNRFNSECDKIEKQLGNL